MKIAFFLSQYGQGGVERMLINTARGLAERGHEVDYLCPADGAFLDGLPESIRRRPLPMGSRARRRALATYMADEQCDFVIVGKDDDAASALAARRRSRSNVRVIVRPGTTISRRLAERSKWKRWRTYRALRRIYAAADGIVANSTGVRDDIADITGVPAAKIFLVRNPVITPDFHRAATGEPPHPWLMPGEPPVLLGAGGLRRQKDFATLIDAFARVRSDREVRLIILGTGHLEGALAAQAQSMGVVDDMALPGFVENPYPWMKHASLFVLSSLWEGSPNVLTEALALGTPVVSTDCPSGPQEILQGGRYGCLTPPGDAEAMAEAIRHTLGAPLPAATLQEATAEYTMERNAAGYEAMLTEIHARVRSG